MSFCSGRSPIKSGGPSRQKADSSGGRSRGEREWSPKSRPGGAFPPLPFRPLAPSGEGKRGVAPGGSPEPSHVLHPEARGLSPGLSWPDSAGNHLVVTSPTMHDYSIPEFKGQTHESRGRRERSHAFPTPCGLFACTDDGRTKPIRQMGDELFSGTSKGNPTNGGRNAFHHPNGRIRQMGDDYPTIEGRTSDKPGTLIRQMGDDHPTIEGRTSDKPGTKIAVTPLLSAGLWVITLKPLQPCNKPTTRAKWHASCCCFI